MKKQTEKKKMPRIKYVIGVNNFFENGLTDLLNNKLADLHKDLNDIKSDVFKKARVIKMWDEPMHIILPNGGDAQIMGQIGGSDKQIKKRNLLLIDYDILNLSKK